MAIRLYNHTRYNDAVIRMVLNFAVRMAGTKDDVPVKVTYSWTIRGSGHAHNSYPYRKTLIGKPTTSQDKRLLHCQPGWIELHLPRTVEVSSNMALDAAEWFVGVAIHEMAHIADYRSDAWMHRNDRDHYGYKLGQRRMAHDSRPCEIFAQNVVDAVEHNKAKDRRRQELVIALAIELESKNDKEAEASLVA